MGTLRFAISVILGIALPYALQRWDRARLTPEQRATAWNAATWGAALYAVGPLSMIPWAWVTRQRFWAWHERDGLAIALLKCVGLLLAGLAATVVIGAAITLVDWGVGEIAGEP